ncbi:MAG: choice-of-anchor D domain-containing protein [Reichenbachiella sp.]|uniref:DUF7619 domain-containing protein n=1 Tax=Reichenbachiella sp. TaxID=2184521 RepID=UPI0032659F4F
MLNSSRFIRLEGTGGDSQITAIEYFFDQDPGIGEATPLDFTPAMTVDSAFVIPLPDLPVGAHQFHIRAKDQNGRWSLLNQQEVCFPTAKAKFSTARFGNRFSFIDESKGAQNYHWDFGDELTSTVSNPVHEFSPGEYDVRQIVWNECSRDTTFMHLSILGIEDFEPKVGGNTGDVTLSIFGGGLTEDVGASLIGINEVILPIDTFLVSSSEIRAIFDLRSKDIGNYKLAVKFPNKDEIALSESFTIESGVKNQTKSEILGSPIIRAGGLASYRVKVTNESNIDALGVPFWLILPDALEHEFEFDIAPPLFDTPEIDFDTVTQFILIDSLFENPIPASKAYYFIIPKISSFESIELPFKIRAFNQTTMRTWTNPNIFGSPADPDYVSCLAEGIVNGAPGVVSPNDLKQHLNDYINAQKDTGGPGFEERFAERAFNGKSGVKSALQFGVGGLVAAADEGLDKSLSKLGKFGDFLKDLLNLGKTFDHCDKSFPPPSSPTEFSISRPIRSFDPNEKYSSNGSGIENFINSNIIDYEIAYENVDTASAAAQIVTLIDTLDRSKLNVSSLHLNYFIIGDSTYFIPPNRSEYTTDIDLRPGQDLILRFTAKVDSTTGIFTSKFLSLDSETLELTDDVFAGFLPPNVNAPEGEGRVGFSIRLKDDLPHGTEIRNKATIIFDFNEPITTNETLNTLDLTKPSSSIISHVQFQKDSIFNIDWSGSDVGTGVFAYDVYQSVNDNDFELMQFRTSDTNTEVKIKKDSVYSYYVVATDSVGNVEAKEPVAEYTTELGESIIAFSRDLDFGFQDINTSASKEFTLSNTGNVTLVVSDIQVPNGYALDFTAGTIQPNESQTVSIAFSPDEAKVFSGDVKVISDAENEENTLKVSGTGAAQILAIEGEEVTVNAVDESETGISIYPNPVGNEVTIDFQNYAIQGPVLLSISNSAGAEIYNKTLDVSIRKKYTIDAELLPTGVLNFSLSHRGKVILKKVLKK